VGAATVSLFAAGCSSQAATVGVLGNGQFRYVCGSAHNDSACTGAGSDTDLPAGVAVGAVFDVSYAPSSSNSNATVQGYTGYQIVPASTELASATGSTIGALRAGLVALLAQRVGNANVDDFVHVKFEAVHSVSAQPGTVTVAPGGTTYVTLSAFDMLSAPLAGRIACQWTVSSGSSVVAVTADGQGGTATVQGMADGQATLHATCGAASIDVPVTVSGAPVGDGGTNG
jgi:hypothetical protein